MNTQLSRHPLPSLSETRDGRRRRYQVADLDLRGRALYRFQWHAETLRAPVAPPSVDCLATVARRLYRQFPARRRAPAIGLRLRCLAAVRSMAVEPHWQLDPEQRQFIAQLLGYAAEPRALVPVEVPVIGGLDRALLLDMAWPRLQNDVEDYLEYRSFRAEEAALRGVHPGALCFSQENWLEARAVLQQIAAHRRSRPASVFSAPLPGRFQVR